jgi:hypothetical protein
MAVSKHGCGDTYQGKVPDMTQKTREEKNWDKWILSQPPKDGVSYYEDCNGEIRYNFSYNDTNFGRTDHDLEVLAWVESNK